MERKIKKLYILWEWNIKFKWKNINSCGQIHTRTFLKKKIYWWYDEGSHDWLFCNLSYLAKECINVNCYIFEWHNQQTTRKITKFNSEIRNFCSLKILITEINNWKFQNSKLKCVHRTLKCCEIREYGNVGEERKNGSHRWKNNIHIVCLEMELY